MSKSWQLQEAKNRLSEVVGRALSEGPQIISRRGQDVVVVVALEDYARAAGPEGSLVEFFRSSPLRGVALDTSRPRDYGRDVGVPD
jgi:prevent-host-death family protein